MAYVGPKKWNRLHESFHHVQSKHCYKLLINRMIGDKSTSARLGDSMRAELNESV